MMRCCNKKAWRGEQCLAGPTSVMGMLSIGGAQAAAGGAQHVCGNGRALGGRRGGGAAYSVLTHRQTVPDVGGRVPAVARGSWGMRLVGLTSRGQWRAFYTVARGLQASPRLPRGAGEGAAARDTMGRWPGGHPDSREAAAVRVSV